MGKGKDLRTAETQKITLLSEGMSTLEILNRALKVVENITKLRTQSKGKGFKNLLAQDECKLK